MVRLSQMKDIGNSPEKQVAHNRRVAAANGLHIIAWAQEWDVSGTVSPFVRKGFGPWLRDEMGRYDGIVASAVDRIGRDLLDTLSVGRHMTTTDRLIYTYGHDGPWNLKDELDEQAFTFQALGAQMELRSIQRRTSQTSESMRAQGRKTACLAYGYRYVRIGESRRVDHIEVEQEIAGNLRTVARRILADETDMITPASEARRLTLAGILTPSDLRRVRQGKEAPGQGVAGHVTSRDAGESGGAGLPHARRQARARHQR
jgi:site-specific DNA recombinase